MWYWDTLDTLLVVSIFLVSLSVERKVEKRDFGVLKKFKRICTIVIWKSERVKGLGERSMIARKPQGFT